MNQNSRLSNKAPQWSFSIVQAGFWMTFCVSVSFAAVYLQALGYSNTAVGQVLALGSLLGVIVSLSLSAWIDKRSGVSAKKLIPVILILQTLSVLVLLFFDHKSPAVYTAFISYIGFCTSVNALNLKLYADSDHAGYKIDYGFTRGIGSLAYVLISVLMGALMERISYHLLPVMGLLLCGFQLLSFFLFARFVSDEKRPLPSANITRPCRPF